MIRSALASLAIVVGISGAAMAQPAFTSDCIPPPDGAYVGQFHSWGGGMFNLSDPIHAKFTSCDPPPPPGGVQVHTFLSIVSGTISGPGMPPTPITVPNVPAAVRVAHAGESGPTRFFDTEMLQLDISGAGGMLLIRESPTLPSLGRTDITDLGGGMWAIDSFFDVFTELSLDGGQSWIPSDGFTRMTLIPAPGAIALAAAGLFGAARRRRG